MTKRVHNAGLDLFEKFLEDPSWATHVCVPAGYLPDDRPDLMPKHELLVVSCAPYEFTVGVFPLDTEDKNVALRVVIDSVRPELVMRGRLMAWPVHVMVDGELRILPLLMPERGATFHVNDGAGLHLNGDRIIGKLWLHLRPFARRFSSLANLNVFVHLNNRVQMSPRPPLGEDGIRIFIGSAPTGELVERQVRLVCGLPITADAEEVTANGPTPGRGSVFNDESGQPAVQIVGDHWYLLAPLAQHVHAGTGALFEKLLAIAWQGWLKSSAEKTEPVRMQEEEAFLKALSGLLADAPDRMNREIDRIDGEIALARQLIAALTRERTRFMMAREGYMSSGPLNDVVCRMTMDYDVFSAMPELEAFWFDDEQAFQVRTKLLACEHEGKKYAVGSYGLRIGAAGVVSVWSEVPAREDGVPHPHMPKDSAPCFGNAGDAVMQAAGEYRYGDVVRYVLDWLTMGYSPDVALMKIEEWPEFAEPPVAAEKAAEGAIHAAP